MDPRLIFLKDVVVRQSDNAYGVYGLEEVKVTTTHMADINVPVSPGLFLTCVEGIAYLSNPSVVRFMKVVRGDDGTLTLREADPSVATPYPHGVSDVRSGCRCDGKVFLFIDDDEQGQEFMTMSSRGCCSLLVYTIDTDTWVRYELRGIKTIWQIVPDLPDWGREEHFSQDLVSLGDTVYLVDHGRDNVVVDLLYRDGRVLEPHERTGHTERISLPGAPQCFDMCSGREVLIRAADWGGVNGEGPPEALRNISMTYRLSPAHEFVTEMHMYDPDCWHSQNLQEYRYSALKRLNVRPGGELHTQMENTTRSAYFLWDRVAGEVYGLHLCHFTMQDLCQIDDNNVLTLVYNGTRREQDTGLYLRRLDHHLIRTQAGCVTAEDFGVRTVEEPTPRRRPE
ncbi:hypothetical protein KIPB_006210 [Kipferlia bialata]|uniref:Uncharacterized protein n=1 Tax=Kipferlia bialata TaxID=797122 RepID=A0A9K3CZA6_9EUKA|nr:hypothetical protein KIPB_006210 [Kipferlia bialata]|eukprot:g6210.t1